MLYYVESGKVRKEVEADSHVNAAIAFVTDASDYGMAIAVSLVAFGKRNREEIWFSTESLLDEIRAVNSDIIHLPDPQQSVAKAVGD